MLVLKHLHDYKATFHKVQFRMGGDFSVLKNTSAYCNLPFKTYCNNSQDLFSCVDALHDDDILHEITVGCTQICLGCKEGQLGENVTKACILLVVFAERLVFLSVTLHHKPQSSQPVRQQTADILILTYSLHVSLLYLGKKHLKNAGEFQIVSLKSLI